MNTSSRIGWWVVALALVVASAGLAYMRVGNLPDLPVDLGPDLSVRDAQLDERGDSKFKIARGDQLTALDGHAITHLSEVRSILSGLVNAAGDQMQDGVPVDFQAIRPMHRFTLTLRGEAFDSMVLPGDVEPTDDLVEVDGRALPGKVGPEGLKSIMASRPEAVLGFERRNAVLGGKLQLSRGPLQMATGGVFGVALLVVLLLIQLRSRRLDVRFAVSVALETTFFAWVMVMVFRYQWVIADQVLAACVVSALVIVRPIAFVGRSFGSDDESRAGPYMSLALAVVAAIVVNVLMMRETFTTERALQFGAVTGMLYVVYELIAGFARVSGSRRLERSVYLVGVIAICALAALFHYLADSTRFLEDQWVPYVAIALGLIWFSDVILCFRGPAISGLDELAKPEDRQRKILEYFEALSELLEAVSFRVMLYRDERSVSIGQGIAGFEVNAVDGALHDAMAIMVQEGARIPSLGSTDDHTDPMSGIARTMNIRVATLIPPPVGGAQIPNVCLILLGFDQSKGDDVGEPVDVEFLEAAHRLMTGVVWTAAVLEGAPNLATETIEIGPPEPTIDPEKVDEMEHRISELESEAEDLRDDRTDLSRTVQALSDQNSVGLGPPLTIAGSLMEPELLEGLDYLLESNESIVICGPRSSGKRYTSHVCHSRDKAFEGQHLFVDAARIVDERGFPDVESIDEAIFEAAYQGALSVHSCGLLTLQQIKALMHRSRGEFRLYLLFDVADPTTSSALDAYPELLEALEHRELIIPPFRTRSTIQKPVIQYYLNESALRLRKDVLGISASAWEYLLAYDFPGEVDECRVKIESAVARTSGEVLDLEDFV